MIDIKNSYYPSSLFNEVKDISEIPEKKVYVRKLYEYFKKNPKEGYKLEMSNFTLHVTDVLDGESPFFRISHGKDMIYTHTATMFAGYYNYILRYFCNDKHITSRLLADIKMPHLDSHKCTSMKDVEKVLQNMNDGKMQLVLKPATGGSMGEDVYLGLEKSDEIMNIAEKILSKWADLLIESMFNAEHDVRVYMMGGQVYQAVERIRANVKGDGKSSIKELIKQKNKNRIRKIILDTETEKVLKDQGFTQDGTPAKDELIFLTKAANYSLGGDVRDVTSDIHPDIIKQSELICKHFQLEFAGLDILLNDLDNSLANENGVFLEINPRPQWLTIYEIKGDTFIKDLLDYLFKPNN
jgi:D-alanine-D-alanine ligase-like ATP-grasp enzyme